MSALQHGLINHIDGVVHQTALPDYTSLVASVLSGSVPKDFVDGIIYVFQDNYELYLIGIKYTILISITGTIFGLLLALEFQF